MCTPFTPNGQRKEWADEHAKTFFSAIKTIASLRPRVAILENVIAISNNSNSKIVKRALGNLRGYVVLYLKVNARQMQLEGYPGDQQDGEEDAVAEE